ncbi:hypothetical protein, partial [Acinetobacter baumannii]|uniref:hypothetical protein n=1 Tax=Acinetobacter baumannii TaxID=470 RepID=UPI001BB46BEB
LAAFWLLIWLWAGLFKLVGIRLFATLFESSGFIWVASATVVAIGLLAAFWLLIWLWAGLFKLVGIRLFATLFESSGF